MKHSAMNPKKNNHISVTETELCWAELDAFVTGAHAFYFEVNYFQFQFQVGIVFIYIFWISKQKQRKKHTSRAHLKM